MMNRKSVIAVGALGGSGTRVVAEILKRAGVYLGDDLNKANDNLLFTRLFRNPVWYKSASEEQIAEKFELFKKCMSGDRLSLRERVKLIRFILGNKNFKTDWTYILRTLKSTGREDSNITRWGWKEPNTQIYVKHLIKCFEDIKYIHVIRHGLDMAFSGNKMQLKNWGYLFEVPFDDSSPSALAKCQLDYWIEANQFVVETGKKEMNKNFYLLNYDKLCQDPEGEVTKLLHFCQLEVDEVIRRHLITIPKVPVSHKRYLNADLNFITKSHEAAIEKLGFTIENNNDN
jgi:hypothetical protein